MVLTVEGSEEECVLCKQPIKDGGVTTVPFAQSEDDPLWEYSDAIFHDACFMNWTFRDECIRRNDEICRRVGWPTLRESLPGKS